MCLSIFQSLSTYYQFFFYFQAPSHLKELLISQTSLKEFPNFSEISDSLENVFLENKGKSGSVWAPMSALEKLEISSEIFFPISSLVESTIPALNQSNFIE